MTANNHSHARILKIIARLTANQELFVALGDKRDAIIAKLEARVDMLHDLIEQQQDGARHLAGRIDEVGEARGAGDKSLLERIGGWRALVEEQQKQIVRLLAAVPSAGVQTIQQPCDAVELRGPTEEDERE